MASRLYRHYPNLALGRRAHFAGAGVERPGQSHLGRGDLIALLEILRALEDGLI